MSTLAVNQITTQTGDTITLPTGKKIVVTDEGGVVAPGMIVNVKQSVDTAAYSTSVGAVWANIGNLAVSITPKSASNKMLVMIDAKISHTSDSTVARGRLIQEIGGVTTAPYVGDAAGNRPRSSTAQSYVNSNGDGMYMVAAAVATFLDSPNTTNQVTYRFQIGCDGASGFTVYLNRTQNDRNNSYYDSRTASSITVMEIAG
tara:strand:- start:920 stop:1525 length:606 start_codon:yes stop_codon:yes gene_type:complete